MNRAGQFSRPVRQQIGREQLLIIIIEATRWATPPRLFNRGIDSSSPHPHLEMRGESHSLELKSYSDFGCCELLATSLHSTSVVGDGLQEKFSSLELSGVEVDSKKSCLSSNIAVD
jgi:hypothetical protein